MNNKTKATLEKMKNIMRVRNYSKQTIMSYCNYVEKYLLSFDKDPYHIPITQAKHYLQTYNYSSVSQQNQIINGVKFFYKEILNMKLKTLNITRPRKEKKLPKVIDHDHLVNSISKIKNIKHKAIISLAYSTGMRVSEIINLKIKDIDSSRMIIHINNAKGKKDRIVPLSKNILNLLRNYFLEYRPNNYLFTGQKSAQYSSTSCNKIVKKYIGSEYHFHLLRHSALTRLLETGTDIRIIQSIAGHNSPKTTNIYTHVSKTLLNQVNTPI